MSSFEHLPELRPGATVSDFLVQLKKIAQDLEGYDVLSEAELPNSGTQIDLVAESRGKNGVLRLFHFRGRQGITIKLMDACSALSPLDYHATVRALIDPLLKSYRKAFSKRVSWWAPSPPLSFRHSPGAHRIFDAFKDTKNPEGLDGRDWRHFYEFIVYCHDHRVKLRAGELKKLLLDGGFTETEAEALSGAYYHGREILRLQRTARSERSWTRVIGSGKNFGV